MKKLWQDIKGWFEFSETIFLSRWDVFLGFFLAVVATMDWSPLLAIDYSTDFNPRQLYALGGLCIIRGAIGEWARRRNAKFDRDSE